MKTSTLQDINYSKIGIVIVNFNGYKYLNQCIRSLLKSEYPKNKIVISVVDNASEDNSRAYLNNLRRNNPFNKVVSTLLSKNEGFAVGNNFGIEVLLSDKKIDYIITLNNDTKVHKYWLLNLVKFMNQNSNVGIAVGKILKMYNHNIVDSAGDMFSSKTLRVVNRTTRRPSSDVFNKPIEILSACAAGSIIRRKVLEDIKLGNDYFDSDFVSYIEDIDLNIRARLMGWKVYYTPKAIMYHMGSATSSKLSLEYREYYSRRNRLIFALKNFPPLLALRLISNYLIPNKKAFNYYTKKASSGTKSQSRLNLMQIFKVHIRAIYSVMTITPKIMSKRNIILNTKRVDNSEINLWLRRLSI